MVNQSELIIDDVSGFVHDDKYQRNYQLGHFHIPCRKASASERLEPFSRLRRYLKRRHNANLPFEKRNYIQQEGRDFDVRLLDLKFHGDLYLEGYWQSEGYFKDAEDLIRGELTVQPPGDAVNQEMADCIHNHTAIAVHVRFFDEPHREGDNNASEDYYRRAITIMEQRAPNAHYYLFSDRPETARERIPLPDARITSVTHNRGDDLAFADLWLMSHCKHFIIANSTFSWWGAWLANNQDKQVVAPKFKRLTGKAAWGFEGLLPKSWIKL